MEDAGGSLLSHEASAPTANPAIRTCRVGRESQGTREGRRDTRPRSGPLAPGARTNSVTPGAAGAGDIGQYRWLPSEAVRPRWHPKATRGGSAPARRGRCSPGYLRLDRAARRRRQGFRRRQRAGEEHYATSANRLEGRAVARGRMTAGQATQRQPRGLPGPDRLGRATGSPRWPAQSGGATGHAAAVAASAEAAQPHVPRQRAEAAGSCPRCRASSAG